MSTTTDNLVQEDPCTLNSIKPRNFGLRTLQNMCQQAGEAVCVCDILPLLPDDESLGRKACRVRVPGLPGTVPSSVFRGTGPATRC